MKKIILMAALFTALQSFSQTVKPFASTVPFEVLTDDSTYWTISTLSSMNYVNTTPGAYFNTYKSGGGMIVKFKFKPGNRFEFMLYVQVNTYGLENETWTHVEGNVEFKKDSKGQNIFVTKADKGTYRVIKNGQTTSRPIPKSELDDQHSCTFLWEKTLFADDPNHIYFLVVDLEKHPNADVKKPGSIDREWVSKFHIPKP
jgi:hypothetical protein